MAVTTREGSATRHGQLGLSLDDVKGMYRYILMTRLVSERILQLNRMGRTPFGVVTRTGAGRSNFFRGFPEKAQLRRKESCSLQARGPSRATRFHDRQVV